MADISQRIERMVAVLDENKTALDAARLMSERFIGSVVITGSATVKGIFTERDLMKCVIAAGLDPAAVVDHLTGERPTVADEAVQLPPYGAVWLV